MGYEVLVDRRRNAGLLALTACGGDGQQPQGAPPPTTEARTTTGAAPPSIASRPPTATSATVTNPPSTSPRSTAVPTTRPTTTAQPPATTAHPSPTLPAGLRGTVLTRLPATSRVVALTFDGGAGAQGAASILATLRREGVPASFFVTGMFATANPGTTRALAALGPVGNHSWGHADLTTLSASGWGRTWPGHSAIVSAAGQDPHPFFRFPYGAYDSRTLGLVNGAGYGAIGWTTDSLGWKGTSGGMSVDAVVARVLAARVPGQIVLMHLGANPDDGTTLDAAALPRVIAATAPTATRSSPWRGCSAERAPPAGRMPPWSSGGRPPPPHGPPLRPRPSRRARRGARALAIAVRAPSAGFTQGWDFVVLDTAEQRRHFWSATADRETDAWMRGVSAAPVLIVCCSNPQAYLDRYAEPDKGWTDRDLARWPIPYWDVDTGMAALLALLAAVDEGLGALFFGVPAPAHGAVRRALGIPDTHRLVGVVALGHEARRVRAPACAGAVARWTRWCTGAGSASRSRGGQPVGEDGVFARTLPQEKHRAWPAAPPPHLRRTPRTTPRRSSTSTSRRRCRGVPRVRLLGDLLARPARRARRPQARAAPHPLLHGRDGPAARPRAREVLRVVGDVMGKYHPHGDSAIYDALVRMAQPFTMRLPLVDGHGNFGSLDDGPAASRYTEARLAPAALLMTASLDEDTVDYIPNYDDQLLQPAVLPAAFPNLLVNGPAASPWAWPPTWRRTTSWRSSGRPVTSSRTPPARSTTS